MKMMSASSTMTSGVILSSHDSVMEMAATIRICCTDDTQKLYAAGIMIVLRFVSSKLHSDDFATGCPSWHRCSKSIKMEGGS